MRRITLIVILTIGCMQISSAQTDMPTAPKTKTTDQYLGVQLNDLIRQVFNFNNSTTSANTNPYLLTYSINSRKTGWGIRVGAGYTYNSSATNDGITSTTTKINDMHFRVGVDKAFKLSDKWTVGAGLDLVYNNNDDHTTTVENASFGNPGVTTDTKTTITSYGGGPMGWLRYAVTPRILLGTEASFYYVTGTQKQTITILDPNNPNPSNNPDPTTDNLSQGNFSSPIVFFLLVKF